MRDQDAALDVPQDVVGVPPSPVASRQRVPPHYRGVLAREPALQRLDVVRRALGLVAQGLEAQGWREVAGRRRRCSGLGRVVLGHPGPWAGLGVVGVAQDAVVRPQVGSLDPVVRDQEPDVRRV